MKKSILLILLIVCSISIYATSITKSEKLLFNTMLAKVELDTTALNFPKNWGKSDFKMKIIHDILEEPFLFSTFIDSLKNKILIDNYFDYFVKTVFDSDSLDFVYKIDQNYLNYLDKLVENISKPDDYFQYIDFVAFSSIVHHQNAFEEINQSELKIISDFVVSLRDENEEKYEKLLKEFNENEDLEIEDIIDMIKKIDMQSLIISGIIYKSGIDKLTKVEFDFLSDQNDLLEFQSVFGTYAIGTPQTDFYQKKYSFIYDVDGDDIYRGEINTDYFQPFYSVIDKSGNDIYQSDSFGQLFSTFFGCGISYDFAGNDYYYGDDFMFSANFGINIHKDFDGKDQYIAKKHSLAAATFGISIIEDKSGNDYYSVTEYGQGFAGPFSVGAIIDFDGNDNYFAGGEFLHKPLAPFDHRSLSQGCSFGIRPDIAGGIGIIFDEKGNDNFNGGVFSQAVGYWYGLGIIINLEGNDSYHSVYYPQGSGIHL
ncbi:MAG: hypothetical protein U9N34_06350, partial [Candidatus Cloacimonadota bacterium]|nr:hypothetical protein [Candidatus Cloacimonadota bacterium]